MRCTLLVSVLVAVCVGAVVGSIFKVPDLNNLIQSNPLNPTNPLNPLNPTNPLNPLNSINPLNPLLTKPNFLGTLATQVVEETENEVPHKDGPGFLETSKSFIANTVIKWLSKPLDLFNFKSFLKNVQNGRNTPGACATCKVSMASVQFLVKYGNGVDDVAFVVTYFCKKFKIQTDRVCEGYVENFIEEFVVAVSHSNLDSEDICGTLLGDSCSTVSHPLHNWTVPIPNKARVRKSLFSRSFHQLSQWGFRKSEKKHFKVLQISDIHLDPEYIQGSNAICGEPLCCRASSPLSKDAEEIRKAGYWGDYHNCDIPLRTVEESFRFIRNKHPEIDYVIWTGDIPPHDIWNQTRQSQVELINVVGNLFEQYFGHIPIFPVVGNHETLPMNSFPHPAIKIPHKYSKDWLYNRLSEWWLRWLPIDTQSTIERGAFYVSQAKPGLKIISLNTNFCNTQNWWILLNSTDPGHQLHWLVEQLTESEENGEMVQIIGHVPPGTNDCIQKWSYNFNRIINRFGHIIKGQFYGHTHNDEFEIFYEDMNPELHANKTYRATNVAYIGPSITTFGNVNPGYRIYTVDEDTFDIVDHHTYFLNLTEANIHQDTRPLRFLKSYSAREAYNLNSLSANEWHKMVMRMKPKGHQSRADKLQAELLWQKFFHHYYNLSDKIPGQGRCDHECRHEILCRLLTAYSHDNTICEHFKL